MSLVVARQWGSMIVIAGDTHLVDPHGERVGVLQGIVKTRILADNLCISFAGSLHWAEVALQEVDRSLVKNGTTMKDILSRIHRESNEAVDFLIGEATPTPLLTEIKNGDVRPVTVAWLGSARGFERFQSATSSPRLQVPTNTVNFSAYYLPEGPDARNEEYSDLVGRMGAVIEAHDVPEVGGFVVPVGLHNGYFQYMDYATVLTHPIQFDLMPKEFTVPFGTAAEGGFGFNLMNSAASSSGLAVYFLQGRCGAAFVPRDGLLRPIPLLNPSPVEFEDQADVQLQIQVSCMFTTHHEFVARAMKRLQASDYDAALQEAERAVSRSNKKEPEPYRCRAIVHATRGELNSTIQDFSMALDLDPTHAATWDNRGIAHVRLGQLDQAKTDFSNAVDAQPAYARGYRHRAMVARLQGDEAQAQSDEAAASAIDPETQ